MKCVFCGKNYNNNLLYHYKTVEIDKIQNDDVFIFYIKQRRNLTDDDIKTLCTDYDKNDIPIHELGKRYGLYSPDIKNILSLNNIRIKTSKEMHNSERYKKLHKQVIFNKYGVENVSQSDVVKQHKKEKCLKNWGVGNHMQHDKFKRSLQDYVELKSKEDPNFLKNRQKKVQTTLFEKYGVTNAYMTENAINGSKRYFNSLAPEDKKKMVEPMRGTNRGFVSGLELRIHSLLNISNITYTCNKFLCGYNFDIVFPNKTIIEVQGDYWHATPKKYKSTDILYNGFTVQQIWDKDNHKKLLVEKIGFKVFYLWEWEIKKMTDVELLNWINERVIKNEYEN